MTLPQLEDKVIERPGSYGAKKTHYVPHHDYIEFWTHLYNTLHKSDSFGFPIHEMEKDSINPYFGLYGDRYDPAQDTPHYFHIGLDFRGKRKTPLYPIADGILDYSGFGVVNGEYIVLSHPEFVTEDGFKLYSMYMHLRTRTVKFSSYQKMLREISLHSYPNIAITRDMQIGTMGNSGNIEKYSAHLHLQLEFRNKKGKRVSLDPLGVLGGPLQENISAAFHTREEFLEYYEKNKEEIDTKEMSEYWRIVSPSRKDIQ